ncbi:MAG: hypothetical protein ABIH23_34195 [bacterium]
MRMTTTKLVLLRIYLSTLGRFAWASRSLKRLMILSTISRVKEPHVPSSRFFTPDQLSENSK